jgi:uncharacterized protein YdeI (YjbR/CyaY-like superfamily)
MPVLEALDVGGAEDWRDWLREHHLASEGVWLIFHRSGSGAKSIAYEEAVEEALAFGWIDSIIKKIDDRKYARKFTPRRQGSVWSKSNIERVERLRSQGRMTWWGLKAFDERTGKVSTLERFNAGQVAVPDGFEAALRRNERAWANFQNMAPSHRKRYLLWVSEAKKPETKEKRIAEAVRLVEKNVKDLLK